MITLKQLLLSLSEKINYKVLLATNMHFAIEGLPYLEIEVLNHYLDYPVLFVDEDFTIVIKGAKLA